MEQWKKEDVYKHLTEQILPLYDDGKYDIENPTEKEKEMIKNRKKDVKKALITMLDEDSHKLIAPKRVCRALLSYYSTYDPKKVSELRRTNNTLQKEIEVLRENLKRYENDEEDRCYICRKKIDSLKPIAAEELDKDHPYFKIKELEADKSQWVKKYTSMSKKAQDYRDKLDIIYKDCETIPKPEWRNTMEQFSKLQRESDKKKNKQKKKKKKCVYVTESDTESDSNSE